MGLLSRILGKDKQPRDTRAQALAALEGATASAFDAEAPARMGACFPDAADFEVRLEGVNKLFGLGRDQYAEALGLEVCNAPTCPNGIRKGLLKYFVDKGRIEEAVAGIQALLEDRPSETEMAVALARHLLRHQRYAEALRATERALKAAPNSIRLYALVGETHFRLGQHEDALNHLKVSCELYEAAFKRGEIMASEFNAEQLEFNRVFALLQEAARKSLGPERVNEAIEGLTLIPSGLGIANEGDRFAVKCIEYRPAALELESTERMAERAEPLRGAYETEARSHALRGAVLLRKGELDEAIYAFRAALDMDAQHYAAFYGWAVAEEMKLLPPPAFEWDDRDLARDFVAAARALLPDWEAMLPRERMIAARGLMPAAHLLPALAERGASFRITPLDVRITDLFAELRQARFLDERRSPKCLSGFVVGNRAHSRLDHFLWINPAQFAFAEQLGLLLIEFLSAEQKDRLSGLLEQARHQNSETGSASFKNIEEFLAALCERMALMPLYEKEFHLESDPAWEKIGAFDFVRHLGI